MPTAAYRPAGFCPHCGYPMDPGRCPECGIDVSPDRLASIPPQVRRRRRIKLALLAALAVALPYGGWRFYRDVNWLRWLPDACLLRMHSWEWNRAEQEIINRYVAGAFSPEQLETLHKSLFKVSAEHVERYPAGVKMPVVVCCQPHMFLTMGLHSGAVVWRNDLRRDDWTISIDGKQSATLATSPFAFLLAGPHGVSFELPELAPGTHQVSIDGTFWLATPLPRMPAGLKWKVARQFVVTVDDRPFSDYIRPRWDPQTVTAMKAAVDAYAWWDQRSASPQLCLTIGLRPTPVPIAFEILARPSGQGSFQSVRTAPLPPWVLVQDAANVSISYSSIGNPIHITDLPVGTETIDVQLRPSARYALAAGFAAYFDGILEWDGLPLNAEEAAYGVAGAAPSRIWNPDEQQP